MDHDKLKPKHYQNDLGFDLIDLADSTDMDFTTFNALKYILRAGKKEGESEEKDLKKALDYLYRSMLKPKHPSFEDVQEFIKDCDILQGCEEEIFKGYPLPEKVVNRIEKRLKQLENESNTKE